MAELKRMRIGIVPVINPSGPSGGGVYQYSMTMLRALHERTDSRCEDEFVVFSHEVPKSVLELLNGRNWTFKPLMLEQPRSVQQKILDVLRGFVGEGGCHAVGCSTFGGPRMIF